MRTEQVWNGQTSFRMTHFHCFILVDSLCSARLREFRLLYAWKIQTIRFTRPSPRKHTHFSRYENHLTPLALLAMSCSTKLNCWFLLFSIALRAFWRACPPVHTQRIFGHRRKTKPTKWSDQFGLRSLACVHACTTELQLQHFRFGCIDQSRKLARIHFGHLVRSDAVRYGMEMIQCGLLTLNGDDWWVWSGWHCTDADADDSLINYYLFYDDI